LSSESFVRVNIDAPAVPRGGFEAVAEVIQSNVRGVLLSLVQREAQDVASLAVTAHPFGAGCQRQRCGSSACTDHREALFAHGCAFLLRCSLMCRDGALGHRTGRVRM